MKIFVFSRSSCFKIRAFGMKFSKEKIIIILTVLVDVIGIGIVIPVMPFYVQEFGASATTITMLFAVFSLCAFFSSPILGALSDKIGRRPVLIMSIASTALGWFVFAGATSVSVLFLGRIIDGMAAGNFSVAQSYMADLAKTPKERTQNMGIIGGVFGIGFIIGPVLGSLLSHISIAFPFWFVGFLATANAVAAWYFLPETNLNLMREKKISINPFAPLYRAASDAVLRTRYAALFLFGLAIAVSQSMFALYVERVFHFGVEVTGYAFTLIGVVMVVNQGYLLKHFWLKTFDEAGLEVWFFFAAAVGFFAMSAGNLALFWVGVLLMAFSHPVLRAVMTSRTTGFVHPNKKGEVIGTMASVITLGMVLSPMAAGIIFEVSEHLPFIISGVLLLFAFFMMYNGRDKIQESKYHHEAIEPVEVL